MVKRRSEGTTIEELIEETDDNEEVDETIVTPTSEKADDICTKRSELIRLSGDGQISQSESYVKKAFARVIDKIYREYEQKRMDQANAFITDMLISKFSSLLGGLNAIENPEELNDELQKDALLKKYVESVVKVVTPYIPLLGLLSGGITTSKFMCDHYFKKDDDVNTEEHAG